jgi:hypothetical protein
MKSIAVRLGLAALALGAVSCGGGSGGSSAPTSPPAASAAASASASAAPTAANVSGAASGLASLSSYKVTVTTTGGGASSTMTSVVVRQPSLAQSFTVTTGGQTTRIVSIGSDVWVDTGSGTFMKNVLPASAMQGMTAAFDPGTIFTAVNANGQLGWLQDKGVEQKNGISATHYHGDHSTVIPAGQVAIPAGATFDLWISTSGNYLVALEYQGLTTAGAGLPSPGAGATPGATGGSIEVSNVNDPTLTVTPPS